MAKSYLFDVPPGVLNEFQSSLITKRVDDNTLRDDDYNSQVRSFIEETYADDILEGMGPWKGVVMRIDIKPVPRVATEGFQHHLSPQAKSENKKTLSQGRAPMLVHLKCRIPILDAHLPIPRTGNTADPKYPDHYIIDQYPTYTAISDAMIMAKVKIGDVVILDFADRKNFAGPVYVSPITAQKNTMVINISVGGFGNIPCAPAGLGNQGAAITGGSTIAPHQGALDGRLRPRNAMNKAVLFGDSQMVGTLGNFFKTYVQRLGYTVIGSTLSPGTTKIGPKPKVARSGSGIHNWLGDYWPHLKSALKISNAGLVVVVLGGNDAYALKRANRYADLVTKIKSVAPNCRILWVGPPPATLKKDGSDSVVKKRGPRRKKFAEKLASVLSGIANLTYIDPHKHMPVYMKTPSKRDGIHVDAAGSRELINNISKIGNIPVQSAKAQVKPSPKRSNNPTVQKAKGAVSNTGAQWKNPELLAAAKSHVSPIMGSFTDGGSADGWLKEKASSLKNHFGLSTTEALTKIKDRDFISGFLVASGKPNINSGKWEPLRIKEMEAIMNQTIKVPGTPRIAGTKQGSQYGGNIFDLKVSTEVTKAGSKEGITAAKQSNANIQKIIEQIRQQSYKFTAAQLVSINEAPLPAPVGTMPTVPCLPVGSMGAPGNHGVPGAPGTAAVTLPEGAIKTFIPVVEDAIYKAAQLTKPSKVDLNTWHQWLRAMCWIESGGVINAINRFGYTGLYQFGRRTWNGTRKFGQKKGTPDIGPFVRSLDMSLNPYNNSLAGGLLMASNLRHFGSMPATGHHLYMAHQQGLGGAKSLYRKVKSGNDKWNTQALTKGDFKRAWTNYCSKHKAPSGGSLKSAYKAGTTTDPWNYCKPSHFYNTWIRKFNHAVKKVSKNRASPKGGISKNKVYIARMEPSTVGSGLVGQAALAKPKNWGVA
jgi:hypothetical protein